MRIPLTARATCGVVLLHLGFAYACNRDRPPKPSPNPAALKLWGFADLHAHPASHLAFGDRGGGMNTLLSGIFWGLPGLAPSTETATINVDMPPCTTDSHYGFDADGIRKATRRQVIGMIDGLTGWAHGSDGAPTFRNWLHSQSLSHQQMHITFIKRAYDGGLRLMVASVTDNQLLSNLWTQIGSNLDATHDNVPPTNPNFDFESAKKQLGFLRMQVLVSRTPPG